MEKNKNIRRNSNMNRWYFISERASVRVEGWDE
jgi:hypothetical protein